MVALPFTKAAKVKTVEDLQTKAAGLVSQALDAYDAVLDVGNAEKTLRLGDIHDLEVRITVHQARINVLDMRLGEATLMGNALHGLLPPSS